MAGAPGVLNGPFVHGVGSPLGAPYGGGVAGALPGLGGFAALSQTSGLRGLTAPGLNMATVLLVSNLNEEVSIHWYKDFLRLEFNMWLVDSSVFQIVFF